MVYLHLGRYALYDHIFVALSENSGAYVWRHMQGFDELATAAIENQCQIHQNIPKVSKRDAESYDNHVLADLRNTDTIPEGWE